MTMRRKAPPTRTLTTQASLRARWLQHQPVATPAALAWWGSLSRRRRRRRLRL
jgi:hypothetical protein